MSTVIVSVVPALTVSGPEPSVMPLLRARVDVVCPVAGCDRAVRPAVSLSLPLPALTLLLALIADRVIAVAELRSSHRRRQ